MGIDLHRLEVSHLDPNLMGLLPATDQPQPDQFDQLKGEFLASLNHELRTPLSGVLGMTDLLLETNLDGEQREYVDAVRECASQLLESLNALLDYSALSAGNMDVQQTEFILPALLEGVASDARSKSLAKGIPLVTHWENLPETVIGDERYLRQILQNLLRNAVKFTSKGQVSIEACVEQPAGRAARLTVRVSDTGIGISSDKLGMIFESFRQLESGLSRTYNGLGLGLALAQKLAILMGGSISVESEVGQGSTFTVRVPLTVNSTDRSAGARTENGHRRILLVDDNRIAQQVVCHLLGRFGYDVSLADDGEAGVRMAGTGAYDLVLMDLQMPGMDGFTAARAIRKNPVCSELPIFALSANYSDDQRVLCRQAGMQGFLSKPVHKEELLRTIQSYAPLPAA